MAIIPVISKKRKSSVITFNDSIEDKSYNTAMVDPSTGKFVYPEGYSISTDELQSQIDSIVEKGMQYEIVETLPSNPKEGVFYYLRVSNVLDDQQRFAEYTYVDGGWEKWGLTYQDLVNTTALKDASNLSEEDIKTWIDRLNVISPNTVIEDGVLTIESGSADEQTANINIMGVRIIKGAVTDGDFEVDLTDIEFPVKLIVTDDDSNIEYTIYEDSIFQETLSNDDINLDVFIEDNVLKAKTLNQTISKINYTLIKI